MKGYKILKKTHIASACVGIILWLSAADASDIAKELGQTNPQIVYSNIIIGASLMIPTVLYLVLDHIQEKYNKRSKEAGNNAFCSITEMQTSPKDYCSFAEKEADE